MCEKKKKYNSKKIYKKNIGKDTGVKEDTNKELKKKSKKPLSQQVTIVEPKNVKSSPNNQLQQEVFKQINSQIKRLSPIDRDIMKDMSKGITDNQIINDYNISDDYLFELRSNPSFSHELKQLVYTNSMAFEEKQVAFTSNLIENVYNALQAADLTSVSPDKLTKMFTDLNKQLNDKTNNNQTSNLDITVQLKQQIGADRMKVDEFGRIKIKPNYSAPDIDDEEYMTDKSNPVINNDTGQVESEEVDYEALEKRAMEEWD